MSRKQIILIGLGGFVLGVIVAAVVANVVMTKTVSQLAGAGQLVGQQMPTGSVAGGSVPVGSSTPKSVDCTVTDNPAMISGDSMKGILENSQKVTVLTNYYACNAVVRGDIIAYNYPGSPIVKKVMGMPGDTFGLQASGSAWNIMINGQVLKNAQGTPYLISNNKMLSYYATSYNGVIPAGTYLILGNDPAGSNDSTSFGLVSAQDFIGKVQQ